MTLVPATKEEIDQLDALRAAHPWQLTLSDFLKKVASEYGFDLKSAEVTDPQKRLVQLPYLVNRETGRVVHLPGTVEPEDQLDPSVTASLCRRVGIPPEDFGLLPEEPYEDDDFDFGDED